MESVGIPRIYADFQKLDDDGRAILSSSGSLHDIERYGASIREGIEVLLYSDDLDEDDAPDELQVEALMHWNALRGCWIGEFDPSEFRHASDP